MNPTRFPQGPILQDESGYVSLEWQEWFKNPEFVTLTLDTPLPVTSGGTGQDTAIQDVLQMEGPLYPSSPTAPTAGAVQAVVSIWAGSGVPNNAGGVNGDFYLRGDGTVGSNMYKKTAGLWGAIL